MTYHPSLENDDASDGEMQGSLARPRRKEAIPGFIRPVFRRVQMTTETLRRRGFSRVPSAIGAPGQ
jgi:hypothetical protein